MNFDQARSYCEAKGDGWHCMTRIEWGLLMRICEMQGFIPLGNNNYGKHSSEQFYKAIPTSLTRALATRPDAPLQAPDR